MLVHLTAHSLARSRPLSTADACWKLWRSLRSAIERVVASCLMPEHIHLIAGVPRPDEFTRKVAQLLAGFARRFRDGSMWEPLPPPKPLGTDPLKIMRQIRYVYRNPDRAGLVEHPASHIWSTYRDILDATLDPWSSVGNIATLLGRRTEGFVGWFRSYVEKGFDPVTRNADAVPLDRILRAAEAAAATLRTCERTRNAVRRQAFVQAAIALGHGDTSVLSGVLCVATDSIRRLARKRDARLVEVVTTYATDARLLAPPGFRRLAA